MDAQYFDVAYLPADGSDYFTSLRKASAGIAADAESILRHQERAVNSTFFIDSVVAEVPPGKSLRQELRLFAGPKRPNPGAMDWKIASTTDGSLLSRKCFQDSSNLYSVGNYAPAIILLTVIVRAGMFPLSRKAAVNAQKMQELAPEMKKINERYKDDMEGKLRAQPRVTTESDSILWLDVSPCLSSYRFSWGSTVHYRWTLNSGNLRSPAQRTGLQT